MAWLIKLISCWLLLKVSIDRPLISARSSRWFSLIFSDGRSEFCEPKNPFLRRPAEANSTPPIFTLAVTQIETVFAFLMMDRFDYGIRGVAMVLFGMAIVMGAVQAGAIRALVARFGERSLFWAGAGLMATSFAVIPFAPTVAILLVPLGVSAGGRGICQPSMMSMASSFASPTTRGAVMGTFTSRSSLARALGPVSAGFLFDISIGLPFWLAAALLVAMLAGSRGFPARVGGDEG